MEKIVIVNNIKEIFTSDTSKLTIDGPDIIMVIENGKIAYIGNGVLSQRLPMPMVKVQNLLR